MFTDNKNFYPISKELIYKMLDKIENFQSIKYVLEPSAGKGKNALPPDFGTKPFNNMDEEEKRLVKDFGLTTEEYNNVAITSNN